jgi:addiction module RelE/StbE family toxin
MKLRRHRNFDKQYKKLKKREQVRVKARLVLFLQDEFNPVLNNHPLRGKYTGYRSINITGDLRALYKRIGTNECVFAVVDSHSSLYG